jgi:hypothetical protein
MKKQTKKEYKKSITIQLIEMNPTYEEWEEYFMFHQNKTNNVRFSDGFHIENDNTVTWEKVFAINSPVRGLLNFIRWLKQKRKK